MQLQDDLLTVFTGRIEEYDGTPVVQLPEQEVEVGDLSVGDTYRIAILPGPETRNESTATEPAENRQRTSQSSEPPVSDGDQVEVEIEGIGDQGDGIARVGPGYVVFVPDVDIGDRVTVEITKTLENFGFAEVIPSEPIAG